MVRRPDGLTQPSSGRWLRGEAPFWGPAPLEVQAEGELCCAGEFRQIGSFVKPLAPVSSDASQIGRFAFMDPSVPDQIRWHCEVSWSMP